MKILVVDDHALVREGLCQVLKGLEAQDGPVEVLQAPHCARAFELAELHPDIDLVLLDYHLPDMTGLEALKFFGKFHPEFPILMLSGSVELDMMRQILNHGAAGFISKAGNSVELLAAVRRVMAGDVYLPAELLNAPDAASAPGIGVENAPQFTPRQKEVMRLLVDGHTNKEISEALQLGDETTKNHVTAVLRALGVKTRLQAVVAAARHGYIKISLSS